MQILDRTGRLLAAVLVLFGSACAAPLTRLEPISPAMVRAEELKQQQLVVEWQLRQHRRVENVGHALLAGAHSFCARSAAPRTGVLFVTAYAFGDALGPAARALGYSDTLVVANVATNSAAARAGLQVGDRVVSIYGRPAPRGRIAREAVAREIADRSPMQEVSMGVLRMPSASNEMDVAQVTVSFAPEYACPYGLALAPSDVVNAMADGQDVYVTTGLLNFVENDEQLGVVIAHEIAHNAMRHIDGKRQNATLGGILGAIIDLGAASQGINTRGSFTKSGMQAGALAFSQDFEREADYVGLYILANAGRTISGAPNVWRRIAQQNPRSIVFAGTHPTTAERFVRMEAAVREIESKVARGEMLRPETRVARPVLADNSATRRPLTPPSGGESTPTPASLPSTPGPVLDSTLTTVAFTPGAREDLSLADRLFRRRRPRTPDAPMAMPLDQNGRYFEWKFGPPAARDGLTVEQVITRALRAYEEGVQAREVGWLDRARDRFYEATQFDGSVALYQAALGVMLLQQGYRAEAEAAFSAATLLEPENPEYRRLLAEARREK